MTRTLALTSLFAVFVLSSVLSIADVTGGPWFSVSGSTGAGKGKNVVLIAGDEEYRSEETFPQLAKILAKHHGFTCTVLFAIDPKDGQICPPYNSNIPGLDNLQKADLVIMLIRWRNLPDDQMKFIVDYVESGKPIIGMRTSTHPFNLTGPTYKKYTWNNSTADYEGGFGRQVFGETWIAHHGEHGKEGTRGIIADGQQNHPIFRGIQSGAIFGLTDVYKVRTPLLGDSVPLLLGEVAETLQPDSKAVAGTKNSPMMPVAWTKSYRSTSGKTARVFTTTMGASQDFANESLRRMVVNAAYWALGMEKKIPAHTNVDFVGEFNPTPFRFIQAEEWKKIARKPEDIR